MSPTTPSHSISLTHTRAFIFMRNEWQDYRLSAWLSFGCQFVGHLAPAEIQHSLLFVWMNAKVWFEFSTFLLLEFLCLMRIFCSRRRSAEHTGSRSLVIPECAFFFFFFFPQDRKCVLEIISREIVVPRLVALLILLTRSLFERLKWTRHTSFVQY